MWGVYQRDLSSQPSRPWSASATHAALRIVQRPTLCHERSGNGHGVCVAVIVGGGRVVQIGTVLETCVRKRFVIYSSRFK